MAIRESVHAKYMTPGVGQCWIQSQLLTSMGGFECFGIDSPKRWYDLQSITIIWRVHVFNCPSSCWLHGMLLQAASGFFSIFPHNALHFKSHQVNHSTSKHLLLSVFAEIISPNLVILEPEVGALPSGGQFFAKFIPKLVVLDGKLD